MNWFLGDNLLDFRNFLHGQATAGVPLSLTIGNFDGVHLGHQQLIGRSVAWAKKHQGLSVVLTFHPHPLEVIATLNNNPNKKHIRVFSLEDQHLQIKKLGVNGLFTQKFDLEFSEYTAEKFMAEFVLKNFKPKHLVVGYDFSFGKNRSGGHEFLKSFCDPLGIEFEIVPALKLKDEIISTSTIRKKIEEGQLEIANEMLGRPFYMKGIVIKGEQRGRRIQFPTANLQPYWDFYPKQGVYVTEVYYNEKKVQAVTNVGTNPTFMHEQQLKVESHMLNFSDDIYGKEIEVRFLKYIRAEMKFQNIEALVAQIKLDIEFAKGFFSEV